MALDRFDRQILAEMQGNGRLTNAELAERIALSPSACHRRVARLEQAGVITGYAALLSPRAVGLPTTVFVEITLSGQSQAIMEAFEQAVALIPDIMECHLMAGTADYILRIAARDSDDFARIHREHLARLPHVAGMHSSFSLRTVCKTTALPI
ncbi:MAG: Lrp/AsnC family transcriptional regulator [Pseudomonadota bacterium]